MKSASLVMPYYKNPGMLAVHYQAWAAWAPENKARLEVVLVDDGSPEGERAAEVERPAGLPDLRIFRVTDDRPWHQHAARNIGAHEAAHEWLILTDMDHLLPEATFVRLLAQKNKARVYTFGRLDAPDLTPTLHPVRGTPKPHPNSFAMTRDLYWRVGGYDEDYCGLYGTDGLFKSRLYAEAQKRHLADCPLIRYPREVVADASTRDLARKEGRAHNEKKEAARRKAELGREGQILTLSMPYVRDWPA